jgi:hypothetical protein
MPPGDVLINGPSLTRRRKGKYYQDIVLGFHSRTEPPFTPAVSSNDSNDEVETSSDEEATVHEPRYFPA